MKKITDESQLGKASVESGALIIRAFEQASAFLSPVIYSQTMEKAAGYLPQVFRAKGTVVRFMWIGD